MKIYLEFRCLLIIWTFCASNAYSQFKFKNDKNFTYHADSPLIKAGIDHPNFGKIHFELRYWINDLTNSYAHEMYVLNFFNDKTWRLTHYQLCYDYDHNNYKIITKNDTIFKDWDINWNKLLSFNVLGLPDEKKVQKTWKTSNGGIVIIGDGTSYIFELITKKKKRSYSYSNPIENLRNYGSNYKELVFVNNIIELLNHQFKYLGANRYKCAYPPR